MRVIPLTSLLSHKGRGSPNRDDTLSLEIKELFKHTLKATIIMSSYAGSNRKASMVDRS